MSPTPGTDAQKHEPILYSGDPIESGGHDGGRRPADAPPRLRGLPVLFLSQGAQVYAGGTPFTDWTTLEDLAGRKEVRAVERAAAERHEPPPDAFVFFNEARTEVKVLLWSDRGLTVLHQRLRQGTFELPGVAPGEKLPVEALGRMLSGPSRLNAAVLPPAAEAPPPSLH